MERAGETAAGVQRQMKVIFSSEAGSNHIPNIYRKQELRRVSSFVADD
jgi:hypothetical protein